MKILGTYWFSSLQDGSFGIVKIQNEADEIKYYIGFGYPKTAKSVEESAKAIAEYGAPIYPEQMKQFLNL